jgi:hypothetical protein
MPTQVSRSRSRRLAYSLATACLVLVAIELSVRVALLFARHDSWLREADSLAHRAVPASNGGGIVHPYFGIACAPRPGQPEGREEADCPVNRLGFLSDAEPVQQRGPDRFLVAITGGSAARQFCQGEGAARLREVLGSAPRLAGRDIRVISFARDGCKQPQHSASINYVLALGAEFDTIVNFDGFNELVVARMNVDRLVNSAYPYAWPFSIQQTPDPTEWAEHFRFFEIRALRQRSARALRDSWFRRSAVRQVLWKLRDTALRREQHVLAATITLDPQRRDFRLTGPNETFADEQEMYRRFADVWTNSSSQMHSLAEGGGIVYLHCLQPTIYSGAKPLRPEEAAADDERYRPSIERGYPLLRESGRSLLEEGVRFRDLTGLFDGVEERVYVDDVHLNPRGNRLLAERFAEEILAALPEPEEATPLPAQQNGPGT